VSEANARPPRRGGLTAAIAGGLIGSLLTAALLLFALPGVLSSRIVRQGLLADPKILSDAVDALRDAQYAPVLSTNRAAIETPFASSWKGAAKADVTLVEFFDYACPFCKAAEPRLEALVKADKGVRLVVKEFPILTPASPEASRAALAAARQGRYAAFHEALLLHPGTLDEAAIFGVAKAVGLDLARLRKDMADPRIGQAIEANLRLARAVGVRGTPTFIVDGRILTQPSAAIDFPALAAASRQAHAKS
jgi:protein-disulfide isomerase